MPPEINPQAIAAESAIQDFRKQHEAALYENFIRKTSAGRASLLAYESAAAQGLTSSIHRENQMTRR